MWTIGSKKRKRKIALEVQTLPKAKAWMNIDDANDATKKSLKDEKHSRDIKRHIRHLKSYRGGGSYGRYGGYDITLLELESPFNNEFACLPSPKFDDIRLVKHDSVIIGYGEYRRSDGATCETNRFGKMKFHYCNKNYGVGKDACNNKDPPPMPRECSTFFNAKDTPNTVPADFEEIKLVNVSDYGPLYCYPNSNPENASFGWCRTKGNYYDMYNELEHYEWGWGFCGKDCFLSKSVASLGTLRQKHNVKILDEVTCDKYLAASLPGNVKVKPKILCVGLTERFKESVWRKTSKGFEVDKSSDKKRTTRYGLNEYVASVGTCLGDSGGPLFIKEDGKYIITGLPFSLELRRSLIII